MPDGLIVPLKQRQGHDGLRLTNQPFSTNLQILFEFSKSLQKSTFSLYEIKPLFN